VNARGYKQNKGIHYDKSSMAAPVTNDTTIQIIYVLTILDGWSPCVIDVQGAFLNVRFGENKHLYMEIPDGFEEYCDKASNEIESHNIWAQSICAGVMEQQTVESIQDNGIQEK